jgi:hypothetical protein
MPRCKSRTSVSLGAGCARARVHAKRVLVGDHFQPLIIMPKIKTSRTKKAPEGFEEIEPVRRAYFTVPLPSLMSPLPRSLRTMGERCATPKMNPMKANASQSPFGLSCAYRMPVQGIYMTSTTNGRRSAGTFTTGS